MIISWVQTVPPASEPVSLTEAKLHLRVDISDDDALITALITAARQYVEAASRQCLITQTWRMNLVCWPATTVEMPKHPLLSVTGITYTNTGGTTQTLSTDVYEVDTDAIPGRIVLADDQEWPTDELAAVNPIQVTFTVGYGATGASVPQLLRQAILMLVAHWYENREPVITGGAVPKEIPMTVESLIYLHRVY